MPPPVKNVDPLELNLLLPVTEPVTPRRVARDTTASIVVHILLIWFFLSLPEGKWQQDRRVIRDDLHRAVHLVMPRFYEPTQREPNKGKISRELDVNSIHQAAERQAPRLRAPAPPPGPVAQAPIPTPTPAPVIPPPKIEVAQALPPPTATAPPKPPLPTPPPQPVKPKLAFEDVATVPLDPVVPSPRARLPRASSSVTGSTQDVVPGANGTVVGDTGDSTTSIAGAAQSASAGRIGSNLQLLSDAKGVDFKPYLIQVLMAVRRNWLAIIPESARLGRRGRVLIQFAIDRTGGVPKLVIAEGTGAESLDRAAVAAISASYPFPPLPSDYKGDEIRLQLAFAYNMPASR